MNERIKELANLAKIQMVSEPRLEEFAQLIAKDCIAICISKALDEGTCAEAAFEIKEHFGVEE